MQDTLPSHDDSAAAAARAVTPAKKPRDMLRNWDWMTVASFGAAGMLGVWKVANDVRIRFWETFVRGHDKIGSPFHDLRDANQANLKSITDSYNAKIIEAATYDAQMHVGIKEYQGKVADRLLKEFDIPTHGIRGWTEGTIKRIQKMGMATRIDNTLGFAAGLAVTVGAFSVLRHSKHTVDRIEDKLDQQAEQRGR